MIIHDPYDAPGEYRKAQLHCHTTESDGRFRPRELLRMYKDAGYSFVFITDHNRVTRCDDLNDGHFLVLPGTEDTVSRFLHPLGPHMARLFVDEPLRQGSAQERIDRTIEHGGIVSLCHPSWTGNLWTGRWNDESVRGLRGFHLMEIWNPHSGPAKDVQRWAATVAAHGPLAPVWGVAVDDCHHRRQFNQAWVMVKVPEITQAAFRQALLSGACYASTGPEVEFRVEDTAVMVRCPPSARGRFIDARGQVRADAPGPDARYIVRGDEGYLRVECLDRGKCAWSQPFWIATA